MKIKLDSGASMPVRAHLSDAGYDLFAKEDFVVPKTTYDYAEGVHIGCAVHDTGVRMAIPKGHTGFIKSKSGLNVNKGIIAEGVIDSGYVGSVVVKLYNLGEHNHFFRKGDKITQIVILPIHTPPLELVDELEDTERGVNGFGSSGV